MIEKFRKNASNKFSNFGCCGACICFGGNEVLKPFNALSIFVKSNLKYTLMSAYLIGRIISYHPAEMRKDTQG